MAAFLAGLLIVAGAGVIASLSAPWFELGGTFGISGWEAFESFDLVVAAIGAIAVALGVAELARLGWGRPILIRGFGHLAVASVAMIALVLAGYQSTTWTNNHHDPILAYFNDWGLGVGCLALIGLAGVAILARASRLPILDRPAASRYATLPRPGAPRV